MIKIIHTEFNDCQLAWSMRLFNFGANNPVLNLGSAYLRVDKTLRIFLGEKKEKEKDWDKEEKSYYDLAHTYLRVDKSLCIYF